MSKVKLSLWKDAVKEAKTRRASSYREAVSGNAEFAFSFFRWYI